MNAGRVWGNVIFFRGIKVILSEVPFYRAGKGLFRRFLGGKRDKKKKEEIF